MKTKSTIRPEAIWFRGLNDNIRTLNLVKNITQEIETDKEGKETPFFTYDEITVEVIERPNMEHFVLDNFDNLFSLGSQQIALKKIRHASIECNQRILNGFESDCLGKPKRFDAELTDQATIQGLTITAMLGLQGLTQEETHWKGTGELSCYKFEYAQIIKLATDLKKHVETNINQFNVERLAVLGEYTS